MGLRGNIQCWKFPILHDWENALWSRRALGWSNSGNRLAGEQGSADDSRIRFVVHKGKHAFSALSLPGSRERSGDSSLRRESVGYSLGLSFSGGRCELYYLGRTEGLGSTLSSNAQAWIQGSAPTC